MHKTAAEAAAFVRRLAELVPDTGPVEVAIAPPFTALHAAVQAMGFPRPFALAAQNLFWEDEGPFTGEVSPPMLKEIGCQYAILGHSERRQLFGDHDAGINKKLRAALRHGIRPILCVGETLQERQAGRTETVVAEQVLRDLQDASKDEVVMVTIAYEPVWAIGTGQSASATQAVAVHALLRTVLERGWGTEAGERIRILYGGSVTPQNVREFLASGEVDGALVGGACLDLQSFATIITLAKSLAH